MRKINQFFSLILVMMVIVCCLSACGGGSYKTVLNDYCKAYEKNDAGLMLSSVLAEYYTNYMGIGWGYNGPEGFVEELIEDDLDAWDCGENIEMTYEIDSVKRATKEEVEGLESVIFDWYADYSFDKEEWSITDAYVLDVYFTVKGDGNREQFYFPDGLLIVKENGKWRIGFGSISSSFFDNNY